LQAVRQFFRDAFNEFERDPHARNVFEIMRLRCEFIEETKPIFLRHRLLNVNANEHITRALQRARQLGQLRTDADPAACARAIQFLVDGALHEWIFSPGSMNLRRDAMAALDALLSGIAAGGMVASEASNGVVARPARARGARARRQ
jgi:TetR/AcrR family acrAB operon transcriptional repressor